MPEDLDDLLHDATKKLERGAPKQALRRLDRAVELAPDDADARALRGRALLELGRLDEAILDLEAAARADPPSADALIELGWLALDDEEAEEEDREEDSLDLAERALEAARALDPRDEGLLADAHALLVEALVASSHPRTEILAAAEEAARELGPDDPVALLGRGQALFFLGRFEEALVPLRKAAEKESKRARDATPFYFLGAALERLGRLEEADRELARAAKIDPEQHVVPFRLPDEAFDAVVSEALASLPAAVREVVDRECTILREDFPPDARVREDEVDPLILGEFVGASHSERTGAEGPAQVLVYRRNLEKESATRKDLLEQVRITVLHEVGHAIGFGEEGLADLGLE